MKISRWKTSHINDVDDNDGEGGGDDDKVLYVKRQSHQYSTFMIIMAHD